MTLSYQTVLRLALPNIISNVLMVSVSFAHLWVAAPLGPEVSAAVVAGGRLHFLLMAAGLALSVATTALVARAWGAKNVKESSVAMSASLWMAFYLSLALSLPTYVFAPFIAGIFGLDAQTTAHAVDFIRPMALMNIIFSLLLSITTSFRAIGDVMRPMKYTAITTVMSILLSFVFVNGWFGLPAMGITGIPVGTGVGHLFALGPYFFFLLRGQYKLSLAPKAYRDTRNIRLLFKIGSPAALEQMIIQSSFIIFMMIVSDYGTPAFAAYGIGITILSVCIVVGLGFGAASSTLTGQAIGADDYEGARMSGWSAMRLSVATMTLLALIIFLLRSPLANMLSNDPVVQGYTETFIIILALVQPLMGIEFAIGGALRGAGDTKYPLYVSLSGILFGRLSLGYLVLVTGGSVEMMYSVIVADYLIKSVLLVLRFRGNRWLHIGEKHIPAAVQSVAGVGREAVRTYYREHPDENLEQEKAG